MGFIAKLDNWTLLASIALVTSMSSFAFARTWGTHRRLRASGSFALAFLVGAISCLLFTLVPDSTPLLRFLNTVGGDTLVLVVYALLLTGIEQLFGIRRVRNLGWLLVGGAFLLTYFFTEVKDSIGARILVNDFCTFSFRVFIGVELLRHAGRKHLRALSAVMLLYALLSLYGAWYAIFRSVPQDAHAWMQTKNQVQFQLFLTLFFFIATSQFLFLILNGELVLQLEREATRDFLTGTLNRRGVERALIAEMGRSQRFGIPLSVGLVDVDHFKQINDTLGHAAGDHTLKAVARLIQSSRRAYDSVGRFGGDEFLVILPNTPASEALRIMERIREIAPATLGNGVTLSIGLTHIMPEEDADALLARVDQALYDAKENGRNCIRMRPSLDEEHILPIHQVLTETSGRQS